jgi:serine/threonine-protein kinase
MGEVWRATHTGTGREFAVKFMHAHVAQSAVARDRFAREARASAQINHPSIIDIFDVGEHDESLYLVMELLSGMLLVDALAGDPRLTVRDFLAVMHDVVEALGAAHAAGIVHRDIKPENVFIHLDRVSGVSLPKVLDFGISKFSDGGSSATVTGAVLGSPRYMSPEQSRSSTDIDGRSDLWACGVILFEALTGTFPHDGDSFSSLIIAICTEPPESIDALAPNLPESVRSIVRDCLQPLDTRIADAAELTARLTIAIEDPAINGLLLARQLHGDGPCSNTAGMRFREIAPGPLSMAMPSRAAVPGPVSSSRVAPRAPVAAPAVISVANSLLAQAPFKAVARTMPITAEDRARLSAYMDSANAKGAGAAFVPTAHTAKVDPAILAEAARALEAKRARDALTGKPSSQGSLQQQPLQPQPSLVRSPDTQPRSSDPQPRSSQPQPASDPRASTPPVDGPQSPTTAPKPPPIAPPPTLRSKVDEPAAPPPEPELDLPPAPAPAAAVEAEAVAAAAPASSGRALKIIAGVLTLALGAVLATLFATMRSPAPAQPAPTPPVSAAPVHSAPDAKPWESATPAIWVGATPTASASAGPSPSATAAPAVPATASPSASAPIKAAPWPSSHYAVPATAAPVAPPAP